MRLRIAPLFTPIGLVVVLLLSLLFASRARAAGPPADAFRLFPLTTDAARALVAAALRASGLQTTDDRMDALEETARHSAWLPEVRFRVARTDDDHTTFLYTDPSHLYDTAGVRMMYEARLSWRLDRLIYSGDEPQIEHLRIVRIEARERLTQKTLDAFYVLERSLGDLARAPPGGRDAEDAGFRAFEAAATLDVLTAGWFSDALRGKAGIAK